MTDIAIRVNNLSKCCQIYDTPRDGLKQLSFQNRAEPFRL